ncbi:MAG TPA: ABC transporter substrate-binding protein, partial [Arthrobacter sp.]|nr:ABC transporter substrate-binding protein [Arthrobacter sp.]
MASLHPRRTVLKSAGAATAALAAVVLSLSACSTGSTASSAATPASAGQFPVTIKNVFGETTIKSQ